MIEFTVYGIARPKGSMRRGRGRAVFDSNPHVKAWSLLVRQVAQRAVAASPVLLRGPLGVAVEFHLPRPQKYDRRGAVAHLTAPDLDKLIRAVLDALTGIIYRDDSQVVDLSAAKRYAATDAAPFARILVAPVLGVSGGLHLDDPFPSPAKGLIQ